MLRPDDEVRLEELTARPLSVPLVEPFVIATTRVDATHAVELNAVAAWSGGRATGWGEAACLPPVTSEDQADVLRAVDHLAAALVGRVLPAEAGRLADVLNETAAALPVTRAGVESAILDAVSRMAGMPLRTFLGGRVGAQARALETDVTVAIADPERMTRLALAWHARGFRILKIKVGADVDSDARALEAIARALPGVRVRVDANAGFSAAQAITLARHCKRLDLVIECWEQPCAAGDLDAMAEVTAALTAPVIADESVKTYEDLIAISERKCADGVNLKLAKMGGLAPARRIAIEARARGLKLMAGGMVETRLGMTAGAHLACSLGGVDFVDLDTAWLLESDPYEGGYIAEGPRYTLTDAPGLGVRPRALLAPESA